MNFACSGSGRLATICEHDCQVYTSNVHTRPLYTPLFVEYCGCAAEGVVSEGVGDRAQTNTHGIPEPAVHV